MSREISFFTSKRAGGAFGSSTTGLLFHEEEGDEHPLSLNHKTVGAMGSLFSCHGSSTTAGSLGLGHPRAIQKTVIHYPLPLKLTFESIKQTECVQREHVPFKTCKVLTTLDRLDLRLHFEKNKYIETDVVLFVV